MSPHFPTQPTLGKPGVFPVFFNSTSPAFRRLISTMLGSKPGGLGALPLYAEQAVALLSEVFIGTEVGEYDDIPWGA